MPRCLIVIVLGFLSACVGKNLASMELLMIIGTIFKRYEFVLRDPEAPVRFSFPHIPPIGVGNLPTSAFRSRFSDADFGRLPPQTSQLLRRYETTGLSECGRPTGMTLLFLLTRCSNRIFLFA